MEREQENARGVAAARVSVAGKKLSDFPEIAAELAAGQEEALTRGAGSNIAVLWRCTKGHEWKTSPNNRCGGGSWCPFCQGKRFSPELSLAALYPHIAAELISADPTLVQAGTAKRHRWRCSTEPRHEWEVSPAERTRRDTGCPYCSGRKADPLRSLGALHPELAEELVDADPMTITCGTSAQVQWQCRKNPRHIWEATPIQRTSLKQGCPYCSGKRWLREESFAARHPDLLPQWDHVANGGVDPFTISAGAHYRAYWVCPQGPDHRWLTAVSHRTTRGTGCPCCSGRQLSVTNSLAAKFPKIALEFADDLNGCTAAEVLGGTNKKYWWRCSVGHTWRTHVSARTSLGMNCGQCSSTRSLAELTLAYELESCSTLDLSFRRVDLGEFALEVDLAWPAAQVALEYDGSYWHRGRERVDRQKNTLLSREGWMLIRVREQPLEKLSENDLLADPAWSHLELVQHTARHLHAVLGERVITATALAELESRAELACAAEVQAEWARLRNAPDTTP